MRKILVLGVTGMLGSMVYDYLSQEKGLDVRGTVRSQRLQPPNVKGRIYTFDAESDDLGERVFKYIVNCIGIIKPYCKDNDPAGVMRAIKVNALFPHQLAEAAKSRDIRIIQIATDCVWQGTKGRYTEKDIHDATDVYGKTMSLREVQQPHFLNIRSSIIGPEIHSRLSLLEWFLGRKKEDKLTGFSHHHWNGVTTLQFAEIVKKICEADQARFDELVKASNTHHLILNETVNKHELLSIFNRVFDRGFEIAAVNDVGPSVDRTLGTTLGMIHDDKLKPMEQAVRELKEYMDKRWPR